MKVKYDEVISWWHNFFGAKGAIHEVSIYRGNVKLNGEEVTDMKLGSGGITFKTATRSVTLRVSTDEFSKLLYPPSEKWGLPPIELGVKHFKNN